MRVKVQGRYKSSFMVEAGIIQAGCHVSLSAELCLAFWEISVYAFMSASTSYCQDSPNLLAPSALRFLSFSANLDASRTSPNRTPFRYACDKGASRAMPSDSPAGTQSFSVRPDENSKGCTGKSVWFQWSLRPLQNKTALQEPIRGLPILPTDSCGNRLVCKRRMFDWNPLWTRRQGRCPAWWCQSSCLPAPPL